jgi:hypothetical protein
MHGTACVPIRPVGFAAGDSGADDGTLGQRSYRQVRISEYVAARRTAEEGKE